MSVLFSYSSASASNLTSLDSNLQNSLSFGVPTSFYLCTIALKVKKLSKFGF